MAQYYAPNPTGYPQPTPPPKKNNTPVIVAIIIVVTVAIIMGLITVAVILNNRPGSNGSSSKERASSVQKEIEMPDLTGMQKNDALAELDALGVNVTVSEEETDDAAAGTVLSHVPIAGKKLNSGDDVTLYVAKAKKVDPVSSAPSSKSSKVVPSSAPVPDVYLYCTADDFVSLRSGPGVDYTEQAKIPRGDKMLYQNVKEGRWYLVIYGSKKGYVYDAYVSYSPPPAVSSQYSPKAYDYLYCTADDFVSLRSGPGVDYTELARIPNGNKMIYLYEKSGKWYYVQYGSQKGYVYEDYVTAP